MGFFFGRKRTTAQEAPGNEAVAVESPHHENDDPAVRTETRMLAPLPPLENDDPRTVARMTLTDLSFSVIFHSVDQIEVLWPRLLEAAPRLGQIRPRNAWIAQASWSEALYIVGIDSPAGSAAIIGCGPGSDTALLSDEVLTRLRPGEGGGWDFDVVTGQRVSHKVADIVENGNVVALTSLTPGASTDARSVMPPALHRALRDWDRISHDTYQKMVTDIDGDVLKVFVGMYDGRPSIVYPFINDYTEPTLEPLDPLHQHFEGRLSFLDESTVVAVRELVPGENPNPLAQPLVDGVARGLAQGR